MRVHIDFETFSTLDLKKVGSWRYSRHPSTVIRCGAYAIDDKPPVLWSDHNFPDELRALAADDTVTFIAHNRSFEIDMWCNVMVRREGFAMIPFARWECTAAKAAVMSIPRGLGKAGAFLSLEKQKDAAGHRVMLKLSKPRQVSKNNLAIWHDDAGDIDILEDYNIGDVEAERCLDHALPDISRTERPIFTWDAMVNYRGIRIDRAYCEAAIRIAEQHKERVNQQLSIITKGFVTTANQTGRMVTWLAEQGYNIPSLAKGTLADILATTDLPANVKRVLELRQEGSKNSVAKYATALGWADDFDDRVRHQFLYFGAGTGRWAGRGVQLHNQPRGTLKVKPDVLRAAIATGDIDRVGELGDPMAVLSQGIRHLFVPQEGHDLIVADYASIETCVLFWYAKHKRGLQMIRDGVDLYRDMAAHIFQREYDQIAKDSNERQVGKQAILGLGFQMGVDKFISACANVGVEMTQSLSQLTVSTYRKVHAPVTDLWKATEKAAIMAIQNEGKCIPCSHLHFLYLKVLGTPYLLCLLPAGGVIAYPYAKLVTGRFDNLQVSFKSVTAKGQTVWEDTYGGKLVENYVQRTARDLLCHGAAMVEGAGYPVVLHVHDELGSEVPEGFGSVEEYEALMSTLPEWAKADGGIPVRAEGWRGKFYRK